jgi:hypothetical protein
VNAVEREGRVFGRYLLGRPVDDEIVGRYVDAVRSGAAGRYPAPIAFDRLLARLARVHPSLTRAIDVYARHFRDVTPVRKRLILMLALLESHAPTYADLDSVDSGGTAVLYVRMTGAVLGSAALLALAAVVLTPARLVLGGRGRG